VSKLKYRGNLLQFFNPRNRRFKITAASLTLYLFITLPPGADSIKLFTVKIYRHSSEILSL
jgi:hypothetical protein